MVNIGLSYSYGHLVELSLLSPFWPLDASGGLLPLVCPVKHLPALDQCFDYLITAQIESQTHRMVWIKRDLQDHLLQCYGQGLLLLDQVAPRSIQGLTMLIVETLFLISNLNLLSVSLISCPLVLSPFTLRKSRSPALS